MGDAITNTLSPLSFPQSRYSLVFLTLYSLGFSNEPFLRPTQAAGIQAWNPAEESPARG